MAYTNIDDPSAYFQTLLWTGNSTDARALTNDGNSDLQPDWVWLKNRDIGYNHFLQDSSRGNTKVLFSDLTNAEGTYTNMVESFDTNGFTVGFDGSQVPNFNGNTFVGWQWKANGGTTSSNTDGTITSTVQANTDEGFSIVTYTGNGSASTIGHGLGVVPAMIIVKCRNAGSTNWTVYHKNSNATPQNYILELNNANAAADNDRFNDTAPTSSVFSVNAGSSTVNQNTNTYVAYCFAEKQGYSKFGSYVGNGNDNGPFIYTGFKPAFVLTKGTNISQWRLYDSARSPNNVNINRLFPYSSSAEATDTDAGIDMLSNGFKIRGSGGDYNASGTTYIYMAFADNPLVTSTGIPTTAR